MCPLGFHSIPFTLSPLLLSSRMGIILLSSGLALLLLFLTAAWIGISSYYLTPLRIQRAMAKQGITGPKRRFLLGNLVDVSTLVGKNTSTDMPFIDHNYIARLFPHYLLWSKLYGKRFLYWYGSEPRLCLTEPELIKELLSSKYVQLSGRSWLQREGSKHLIGEGVLMANGSNWFHQRHVVAPSFMSDKLKGHIGYMVECTKQTIKSLHAAVGSGGNNEVEIGEYLTRLTGDIISRTEFDSSYDKGKKIFNYLTRLQSLTAQSSKHLLIPGRRFFPSKYRKEIISVKMEVERLMMEIIQSRKDGFEFGRTSSYGKGLLGTLLKETQKKRDDFSYTLQLVMDECKTFFFAGHETTALLLTWTIMLLASNPSWQEKARAEVVQVCGQDTPSSEHLSQLTVLNMIINESLRLYPPVTILPRIAFEDIKLGDLHIPKGLSIWIPVPAIHHNEEIWGKDVHEFNPERFTTRSFALTRNFLPFASGPRNCVGQAYALMEAKIILSMMLSEFNFTISKNYRHAPISVLTLRPKHGVPVYVTPLRPQS